MGRHVTQRARRPQRPPAGAYGGAEFELAFQTEETLELARETRSITILDQRGGTHHAERSGRWYPRPPRSNQRIKNRRHDGLVQEAEPHRERATARLWAIVRRECFARGRFQTQGANLNPADRRGLRSRGSRP